MRASGMTLAKAAEELGIAYNTAVNWEKALKERIATQKAIRIEKLQEKYLISKEKRIELFGERLLAIDEELKKRDLSEIPTPKLFEMMIKCMMACRMRLESQNSSLRMRLERRRDERILAYNMPMAEARGAKKRKHQNFVSAGGRPELDDVKFGSRELIAAKPGR